MASDQPIIIVKKKHKGHGGHHGGAWKVAYADFVTAMMAFFLVMWIIGLDQETKAAIEGYFQDPAGFIKTSKGNSGPLGGGANLSPGRQNANPRRDVSSEEKIAEESHFKAIKKHIEEAMKTDPELKELSENVVIIVDKNGMRLELIETNEGMFFNLGSAALKPKAVKVFQIIAKELGKLPNSIEIEGHTDRHQYAANATYTNWELSADRATAARRTMQPAGLKLGQIASVCGYADQKLRLENDPFHYSNRRVTILVQYGPTYGADAVITTVNENLKDKVKPAPTIIHPDVTDNNETKKGH